MQFNSNGIMTAAEVFNTIGSISSYYNVSDKGEFYNSLVRRLESLQAMHGQFAGLEQEAYRKMGIGSIEELQNNLNRVNQEGLINFSARALSKMPPMTEAVATNLTAEEKIQLINEEMEKAYNGGSSIFTDVFQTTAQNAIDTMTPAAIDSIAPILNVAQGYRDGKGISKKSFANQFIIEGNRLKLKNISKTYAKEMRLIAQSILMQNGGYQHLGYNINVDWQEEAKNRTLNYYPYYGLTPTQKDEAMRDNTLWNNFKINVSSLAPNYSQIIYSCMDSIGRENFFSDSPANIQGIMGELGAMVILKAVCPNLKVEYTGAQLNTLANNTQVGVDVFLEKIGFQVKNYKGYGGFGSDSGTEGINLQGTYTLSNFADKIDSINSSDLKMAKALDFFHVQVSPEFAAIRGAIDAINKSFDFAYTASIDNFMPFEQIVQLQGEAERIDRNLFYLISGTKVIPTSTIIQAYCTQLQSIISQFNKNTSGAGSVMSVRFNYSGPTYRDYYKDKFPESFSYGTVIGGINAAYNINLHIPNLMGLIGA